MIPYEYNNLQELKDGYEVEANVYKKLQELIDYWDKISTDRGYSTAEAMDSIVFSILTNIDGSGGTILRNLNQCSHDGWIEFTELNALHGPPKLL